MVCVDNFRILSDEEQARYKFDFCRGCALYDECELVEEYAQYRDNHPQIRNSQIPQSSGKVPVVNATVVHIDGRDITPLQSGAKSTAVGGSGVDKLSYDQEELKDGCIMSRRYVYPIACGGQMVSDGIGDHYKIETRRDSSIETGTSDRWEPLQPIFISAQTGQGKNYFIEHELIPYVRELNYKNNTNQRVLILSNRLALRQQIKNRLKGNYDVDGEEYEIYPYGDYADVMTYQALLRLEKRLERKQKNANSRYIYVICDEAHFFTSDAMFNPHTSKILSAIVRLFQDAVRVYMSATPYECLKYIIESERRLHQYKPQGHDKSHPMVFYHFRRDYSYLDVKIYSEFEELYEVIVKSVNERKERWLVFLDDKEKSTHIKDRLMECAAEYAKDYPEAEILVGKENDSDADTDEENILAVNTNSKNNEVYMEMVKNERLGKNLYVLISTSVLDNGINLTNVDNIVVSDMSKVKCLQMVGRARTTAPNSRKTLYIKRFGSGYVEDRITSFMEQQDAYHNYEQAYGAFRNMEQSRGYSEYLFLDRYYNGNVRDWTNAKHWFGRYLEEPTKLYFNEIVQSMLDRLISKYRFVLNEMLEESEQKKDQILPLGLEHTNFTGQKYLEHQLSWFGKTYCIDDDITFADKERARSEFLEFLESYVSSGESIEDLKEIECFQDEFTRRYDAAFPRADKNKGRPYKYKKMNDLLRMRSIGYKIDGKPQAGPWTVIEFEWDSEHPEDK